MSNHQSPTRILSIDGRPITLAAEADAVTCRVGFQAWSTAGSTATSTDNPRCFTDEANSRDADDPRIDGRPFRQHSRFFTVATIKRIWQEDNDQEARSSEENTPEPSSIPYQARLKSSPGDDICSMSPDSAEAAIPDHRRSTRWGEKVTRKWLERQSRPTYSLESREPSACGLRAWLTARSRRKEESTPKEATNAAVVP